MRGLPTPSAELEERRGGVLVVIEVRASHLRHHGMEVPLRRPEDSWTTWHIVGWHWTGDTTGRRYLFEDRSPELVVAHELLGRGGARRRVVDPDEVAYVEIERAMTYREWLISRGWDVRLTEVRVRPTLPVTLEVEPGSDIYKALHDE